MAQSTIDIEVKGLKEIQRKMEQIVVDLHGAPMLNAMRDSTLMVQRDARKNQSSNVDTGRLRASIWPEIQAGADFVQGVVGSNVVYAPYVEYGTRPHFPPFLAILAWVHRKRIAGGYNAKGRRTRKQFDQDMAELIAAWFICLKIAAHGTEKHPFLIPAFEKNETAIRGKFEHAIEVIVNK